MKCKFLLSTVSFISAVTVISLSFALSACANNNTFEYTLKTQHGVDLSEMPKGPLQLGSFSDQREGLSGKQINQSLSIDVTATDLVKDALNQAFKQGGATLVNDKPAMVLAGHVLELNTNEDGDNIQATVRVKVQVQTASGKTNWQSTILGKGKATTAEGAYAALQNALDKFIDNLFYDDYFLIQIIE